MNLPAPRYAELYDWIRGHRPASILEVGIAQADNAWGMLQLAGPGTRYYGFDLFQPAPDHELDKTPTIDCAEAIRRLSPSGAILSLYEGDTRETLPRIAPGLPLVDLIFIDGGHSPETMESDFQHLIPLLDPDGAIFIDDYWPDHVDGGCKRLVDGLGKTPWLAHFCEPDDVYQKAYQYGSDLRVRMVRITYPPAQ